MATPVAPESMRARGLRAIRGAVRRALRAFSEAASAGDYDRIRRTFFAAVLAISACAALTVVLGFHDSLFRPDRVSLVRSIVAGWVLLHLPLGWLSWRRNCLAAHDAFAYLAFAVLTFVFQCTYTTPFQRMLAQIPLNYTLLFVVLVFLPLRRFLVISSVTCVATIVWMLVGLGRFPPPHELEASISMSAQLGAQWTVSVLFAALLEWHRRHLVDSQIQATSFNVVLQRAVETQTTTIRRQQEELMRAEKLNALGLLAGGIAHDFNNKLTVILGAGEMLRTKLQRDPVTDRWLDDVTQTAIQASHMTRQLLSFGRREMIRPRVMNLNAFLDERREVLEKLMGDRNTLSLTRDPGLSNVLMDPGQVDQILVNLVLNARDAMSAGGRLTIRTENAPATGRPGDAVPGPRVRLSVRDEGAGMTDEVRARLFEPFFTTKPQGSGSGLGLASVYGIVRQNGGEIWADTEPGKGSVFTVSLPADPRPLGAEAPAPVRPATPGRKLTILVVEDEAHLRGMIREYLEGRGHAILAAADAGEAVEMSRAHPAAIDVMLCDVVTPGLPVRDAVARILEARPGLPVIFMSGYADDAAREECGLDNPDSRFLQKPFTPQALVDEIGRTLGGRPA